MYFAMNIDKLNLAPDLFTFRNLYKKVKQYGFWLSENDGLFHGH